MISANMANALSQQMYATGGIRGMLYRKIMHAIVAGDMFISFEDDNCETVQWVLEDFVDYGYKVTRTKKGAKEGNYIYTIRW